MTHTKMTHTKKRVKILIAAAVLLCTALAAFAFPASASGDLDRILSYDITVSPRDDATLDMSCTIRWQVLDDESEGALSWVKIGMPNCNMSSVVSNSSTIDHLHADGEYINVYFTRDYYAGEIVEFSFSWVQSYMFIMSPDGAVSYSYTPGWFDEICVDELTVTWAGAGVLSHSMTSSSVAVIDKSTDESIVLSASSIGHGGKVTLNVSYPAGYFTAIDETASAENATHDNSERVAMIVVLCMMAIFLAVLGIAVWSSYRSYKDPGYWTGGYTGTPTYVNTTHFWIFGHHGGFAPPPGRPGTPPPPSSGSSGGSSHGGSSCACACACACAGGGRAGCSLKNFVGAYADTEKVKVAAEKIRSDERE